MFCIECGQELPATAKFCSNCGAKIISAKTPAQQPILDDIASKAVDIVVMDETPSFNDGGYADDDVRKKAAFFGEGGAPEPQQAVPVRAISTTSSSSPKPSTAKRKITKPKKHEKYSYVGPFFDDLARVELNGRWGFIDKYGNEFICCQYDEAESFNNGFAEVKLDGKWGIINHTGKEVIPCKYDQIGYGNDGVKKVNIGSKWGVIDKSCKEILPIKYDDIELTENFIKVKFANNLGIADYNGKWILSIEYDEIWGSNISDIYLVKQNGKFGYVKYSKGKFDIVIHCCLDHAECFHNEQACIEYYNKIYIIDSNFQVYELRPTISTGAICIIFFSIAVFCASITIGKAYYGVGLFLFAFSIIAIAFSLGGLVTKQPCRVNIDVKKWK